MYCLGYDGLANYPKTNLTTFLEILEFKMILTESLQKHRYFLLQALLALGLQMFVFVILFVPFASHGITLHDNFRTYAIFRDIMISLNWYGEIPWWHPNASHGFPYFYLFLLGAVTTSPLFVLTGSAMWVLGLFGIHVSHVMPLYAVYFGLLAPVLIALSVLLLARQIFRRFSVILFIQIITAFSPIIVFSVTDYSGQELCAYGFFFCAAFLNHTRKMTKQSLALLLLSVLVLSISLGHLFLYWNILFVPLFVLSILVYKGSSRQFKLGKLLLGMRKRSVAGLCLLVLVCVLPAVITFSYGEKVVRSTTGTRVYKLSYLRHGNPLEVLFSGIPMGFRWAPDFSDPNATWGPVPVSERDDPWSRSVVTYQYLGMMVLPLVVLGFMFGRSPWRMRFFALVAIFSGVILLSADSPLFSVFLVLVPPLRAVNHYSDVLVRSGISILLIFSAALGFDVVLRSRVLRMKWWPAVFGLIGGGSLACYAFFIRNLPISYNLQFSFMFLYSILFLIVIGNMARAKSVSRKNGMIAFFLVLCFLDVSTMAFDHVKLFLRPLGSGCYVSKPEPSPQSIGLPPGDSRNLYVENLLYVSSIRDALATNPSLASLPDLTLYDTEGNLLLGMPKVAAGEIVRASNDTGRSNLPHSVLHPKSLGSSKADGLPMRWKPSIQVVSQSYNKVQFLVKAPEKTSLIWKNAWFRFWKARVNGLLIPIQKEFEAFQGVSLPKGTSLVSFEFFPWPIAYALSAAYICILGVFIWILIMAKRNSTRRPIRDMRVRFDKMDY